MSRPLSSLRLGLIVVLLVTGTACSSVTKPKTTDQAAGPGSGSDPGLITNSMIGNPGRSSYPREWKVESLDAAAAAADFAVIVPTYGPVSSESLKAVFVFPTGAVAMTYDSPVKEPVSYVRQEYIEVYEAPWEEAEAPEDVYKRDLESDPDPAKSIVSVAGVPALVVEAHSKKDDEMANPAFVRLVIEGVEVQLSGGEDLALLLAVADSMVVATSQPT